MYNEIRNYVNVYFYLINFYDEIANLRNHIYLKHYRLKLYLVMIVFDKINQKKL